jgi:hypothetical protein
MWHIGNYRYSLCGLMKYESLIYFYKKGLLFYKRGLLNYKNTTIYCNFKYLRVTLSRVLCFCFQEYTFLQA